MKTATNVTTPYTPENITSALNKIHEEIFNRDNAKAIMNETPLEPVYQPGALFVALVPKHLNPVNKK